MDDRELLLDYVRHGSSRAFTALVERHVDLVYSAALRRVGGDPHRAADVTQQVFTDLARKAARLTSHPVLVGWLHQSTSWAVRNLRRSENRRVFHETAVARSTELAVPPSVETADWDAIRGVLDAALDELRDREREAVLLRYFSNLSYAEIGTRLGVGENAARMRVERALERLHTVLKRRGITSTAVAVGTVLSQQAVGAAPAGLAASIAPAALGSAAAAGTATTAGATLLTFMTGKLQLALVVAIAALLATALYRTRTQIAAQREQLDIAQQQHAAAQRRLEQVKRQLAVEVSAERAVPAIPDAAAPNPIEVERKRLDLIVRKGELDMSYAPLFRRLHLDPATLDRLKVFLVERNQAEFDAEQVAKAESVDLTRADRQQVDLAADRPINQQIALLLGSDKMATFEHFQELAAGAAMAGVPQLLEDPARDDQAEALAKVYRKIFPDGTAGLTEADALRLQKELRQQAAEYLTSPEREEVNFFTRYTEVRKQLDDISRAAARQGKLQLSRGSMKFYPSAGSSAQR